MQTAEKFTLTFFFKLLALSVLLLVGVTFKTTLLTPTVDARNMNVSPTSTAMDPDSQQIQDLYFRMVSNEAAAAI